MKFCSLFLVLAIEWTIPNLQVYAMEGSGGTKKQFPLTQKKGKYPFGNADGGKEGGSGSTNEQKDVKRKIKQLTLADVKMPFQDVDPYDVEIVKEQIEQMTNELEKIIGFSKNILQKLDKLAQGSSLLLSLASPIAKWLFGVAVDALLKPDSQEMVALQKIKKLQCKIDDLSVQLSEEIKHLKCENVMTSYREKIQDNLSPLWIDYTEIIDPKNAANLKRHQSAFAFKCEGIISNNKDPIAMLTMINNVVDKNCEGAVVSGSDENSCDWHKNAADIILTECFPLKVLTGNAERREPLLGFADLIFLDILRLELIGSFCANAVSASKIKPTYLEDINQLASASANNMKNWIESNLESIWPERIKKYLLPAVGTEKQDLDVLAGKIANEANMRGPIGFISQVVLFNSKTQNVVEFKWENAKPTCIQILDYRGINIIVSRFEDLLYTGLSAKKLWEEANRVKSFIINIFREHEWIQDLNGVSNAIKSLKVHYANVILLHSQEMFLIDPGYVKIGFSGVSVIERDTPNSTTCPAYTIVKYEHTDTEHWMPPGPANAVSYNLVYLF